MKYIKILDERNGNDAVKKKQKASHNNQNLREKSIKIGYARVSTDDQKIDLQVNALRNAGCDHVYVDQGISGAKADREGLQEAVSALQPGDMLVVWRLDRLGRSLINLVELVNHLGLRDIEFRSLTENIDTSSSGGRLVFHMMAALAEFERSLISERTRAGMEAAKLRGKRLGRPRLVKPAQKAEIIAAIRDKTASVEEMAKRYKYPLALFGWLSSKLL
jgi:DNA invertase Pin-like site-specific DNA recombinase